MAEKKYLDLVGLGVYDAKIKGLINNKEDAGVAQTKADAALSDAKNYADTKTAAVQGNVDTLKGLVGTIPASSDAASVVDYVDKKTAGIASSDALNQLQADVDAIEADYLKAADKTALEGEISTEKTAREEADSALDARLAKTEAFFVTTEGETLDTALDTLIEIQTYIKSEGAGADEMVKNIAANKKAIEDEAARAKGIENGHETRIAALEDIDHEAYKAADTALETKLNSSIATKADSSVVTGINTRLTTAEGEIDSLQAAIGTDGSVTKAIADAKKAGTDAAAAVSALESGQVATNKTNIASNLAAINALKDKVGDGFVAITNEEIDALFV